MHYHCFSAFTGFFLIVFSFSEMSGFDFVLLHLGSLLYFISLARLNCMSGYVCFFSLQFYF